MIDVVVVVAAAVIFAVLAVAVVGVAPEISMHEEYRNSLVDHLIEFKIFHWDLKIRQFAAGSLGKIAVLGAKHVATHIELLVAKTTSEVVSTRCLYIIFCFFLCASCFLFPTDMEL